jgi:hypothetical protein
MNRPSEAFRSANLFETGIGYAVVCRYKGDGRCEAGFFLIDSYCLGVKDGGFVCFSSAAEFQEELLDRLFHDEEPVRMTPCAARKLIEDAAGYARGLGFAPGADYKKACRVLGGITTAGCAEEFVFGSEGKPLYIQGPNDSEARARTIVEALERTCGADGYDYILAVGSDDFDALDEEEESEDWSEEAPGSASGDSHGLHEMARQFEAEQPGVVVRINPEGRDKVSDRLSVLAEPLLDEAADFQSKKAILYLAALAWNLAVAREAASAKILKEIVRLMPGGEGETLFDLLATRMAMLFPDENRIIGKLEIDPVAGGHFNLRAMSLSPEDNRPAPGAKRPQRRSRLFAA